MSNKTCVSICTDKEHIENLKHERLKTYIPEILFFELNRIDEKKLKKYLSDIMLRYAEDWVVSDDFYLRFILPRKRKVLEELRKNIGLQGKFSENWDDSKFNLFDLRT